MNQAASSNHDRKSTVGRRFLSGFSVSSLKIHSVPSRARIFSRSGSAQAVKAASGRHMATGRIVSSYVPGCACAAAFLLAGLPAARADTFSPTGGTISARYNHAAVRLNSGKVLLAGGEDPTGGPWAICLLYDPGSGTIGFAAEMNHVRRYPTTTLLADGKVLAVGGTGTGFGQVGISDLYDPGNNLWSATGLLRVPRSQHTATLLPNGKVLVAGGTDGSGPRLDAAELYDPATGNFTLTGSLLVGRMNHSATLLANGKVLVAGGHAESSPNIASAELYDPATATWSATGSMSIGRKYHSATLLPDGRVLVSGGYSSNVMERSSEIYNPATGTWSTTGQLATARAVHTATLLTDGRVLVTGGGGLASAFLRTAELYNPATGVWITTGSMLAPRIYNTATLLTDGKVLVMGGQSDSGILGTAELYNSILVVPAPEIAVEQPAGADIPDGGSHSMGTVNVGSTVSLTFTIRNTGNADLLGLTTSLSGANPGNFGVSVNPVAPVPGLGGTTTFVVNFSPSAGGPRTATLSIDNNDGNENPFDIALSGTGVVPQEISVEQPAGAEVDDGGTRFFANTLIGTNASLEFTIRNPGGLPLTGVAVSTNGPQASQFILNTAGMSTTIAPAGSTTFKVAFTPTGTTSSTRSASLQIASNDLDENPYVIALTGTGFSQTEDTDGDGLNDWAESQYAALGFDWRVSQAALVNTLNAGANAANLFSPAQVQSLHIGSPLIRKNPATGAFTLVIGLEKSTGLAAFNPFPVSAPQLSINAEGKLEVVFMVPDDTAFFRLQSR